MALLEYEFRVLGKNVVDQALASIERRIAQHNAFVRRQLGGQQAAARTATSVSPAAAMRAMQSEERRAAQQQQREAARQHRERMRQARAEAREKERAEKAAARAAAKEEERLARELARQREYWAKARHASNLQRIKAEERAQQRVQRDQLRALRERETFARSVLGGAGRRVLGTAASVGRAGAAMVGIGGSVLAAGAVSQAVELDERARRLAILGRDAGERGRDPDELRRRITQVAIASGLAPESVARGVEEFTAETGNLESALGNLQTFATVAQASGASIEEIARAAAHLRKLGIESIDDMRQSLASLTMQGKKGSFEIRNMAAEFPEVTAQAANFGLRGVQSLRQLGGLMQVAKTASGTGAEASTAVQAMFRQLAAKSPQLQSGEAFEGRTVEVFVGGDTKGELRDFRDILGDILVQSRGDLPQLQEVFDIRGIKAVNPLISKFREVRTAELAAGRSEKEASEAARSAALAVLDRAANAPGGWSDVEMDARDAMQATAVQLQLLNTKLKDAISSEFFPVLKRLLPELEKLVPAAAKLASALVDLGSWLAKNPWSGLGAAIAAAITIELGKGLIAKAAADALSRVILSTMATTLPKGGAAGTGGPIIVGGPGGGAGAPKPGGGRFGRLASVGGKLLGAGSAALFGHGMGTLVGGAAAGERGAEMFGRLGAGAAAGGQLAGLPGAFLGASVGLVSDAFDSLLTQLEPMGDFFQEMERLAELGRRADERLEEARRNGGRFIAPADQIQTSINQSIEPPNMSVDPMMSVPGVVVPKLDTSNVQTELDAFRNDIIKVRSELSKLRVPDAPNRSVAPSPIKG